MAWRTWNQKKWGQWSNWQQKGSRGGQSYKSLQAQVKKLKSLVSELRQSPDQESSRSFFALISCCAERIAIWTATASIGQRDFGCRAAGRRGGGRAVGETHACQNREFTAGAFPQKGAKETKELIVLNSLIPDCRLTARALSRDASLHDPKYLPSFAQVAPYKGTPADL